MLHCWCSGRFCTKVSRFIFYVSSVCSPSERLISRVGGQARSKTPNADMERSVYGADCASTPTYLNKVSYRQTPPACLRAITFLSLTDIFLTPSAANGVAGCAFWGGACGRRECEANGTQPKWHGGGLAPQPPDCNPQLCEWDFLCSAAPLWRRRLTAFA